MQRPERIVYIGLGSALSGYLTIVAYPFHGPGKELPPYILFASLSFVAVMSNKAAWDRFRSAFKTLKSSEK